MLRKDKKDELEVPSLKRMLALVGEQTENLRPENKPTREAIGACRAMATAFNSYVSGIRLALDADKARGEKPNLKFLKLSDTGAEGAELAA